MVKIAVIVGSNRRGRQTDKLAKWAAKDLEPKADVEIVDLRDYPMPFFDEEISPRYNPDRVTDSGTKKWLDKIAEFDGFVIVTPEYNRSMSAVLKNALDVIAHEIDEKPVALIGHGSTGGAQAVASLRMALPGVGVITIPQALFFSDRLADSISEEGELKKEIRERSYGPQATLDAQMTQLLWYTEALKTAKK
ncbi:MAG: NAD(P)H-dependent oxidoreductase [Candidatus Saccharimonadales bacterium]